MILQSTPSRGASDHVPALDGVRGVAVLIVIIHNAGWIAGPSEQLVLKLFSAIAATGWIGVSLFFALSGFLITGILLESRGHNRFFRSFYLRRTLRIFPLYYAFVAGMVFVAAPLAWSAAWAAEVRAEQWPYWIYVSNWTQAFNVDVHGMMHLWSLAVEEQFYLVWPLLVYALSRPGLARLAVAMIVTAPFIRYGLYVGGLPMSATYLFTFARWDALAAGALLATLIRDDRGRAWVSAGRGKLAAVLVAALGVLVFLQRGFHAEEVPIAVIGQSIIVGLSACLLAYAVDESPRASKAFRALLSWRVLRTLGTYSYAMYVFHFPIHHALKIPLGPWVEGSDDSLRIVRVFAYLSLVLVLTFSASLVSWRLIEKPFLDLKEKWAPRVG
jgi:peptidoglycan/LPS O-acetylase OafA/YrhL